MDRLRTDLALAIFFQEDREDEAPRHPARAHRGRRRSWGIAARLRVPSGPPQATDAARPRSVRRSGEDPEALDDAEGDGEFDDEDFDDEEFEKDLSEEQRQKYKRGKALQRESDLLYEEIYQEEDDPEEGFETYDGHVKRLREKDAALREEIIAALGIASEDERDPRRDMSLYNLV